MNQNCLLTKTAQKLIQKFSNKLSLDVGCGFGRYAYAFKDKAIGLDVDVTSLKQGKGKYDDVVLADVSFLPFRHKMFDLVFASEVLEHLPNEQAQRMLTDLKMFGEIVVLTTPNRNLLFTILSRIFYGDENPNHLSKWSSKQLTNSGFIVHGCLGWVTAQKIPSIIQRIWNRLAWKMPSIFGGDLIAIYTTVHVPCV